MAFVPPTPYALLFTTTWLFSGLNFIFSLTNLGMISTSDVNIFILVGSYPVNSLDFSRRLPAGLNAYVFKLYSLPTSNEAAPARLSPAMLKS